MSSKLANGFWVAEGLLPTAWIFAPQQNCSPTDAQQGPIYTGRGADCGVGTGHESPGRNILEKAQPSNRLSGKEIGDRVYSWEAQNGEEITLCRFMLFNNFLHKICITWLSRLSAE